MHNLFKLTPFFLVFFLVTSCVSLNFETLYLQEQKIISSPELGSTSTRRLGDTLLSKAIATFGPAYQLEKGARIGKARTDEINNRMALIGIEEDFVWDDRFGGTVDGFISRRWPDEDLLCASPTPICKDINTDKFVLAYWNPYELLYVRDIEEGKVKEIEKVVVSPTNFKQELIYNGRVGDGLKFIYREFAGDLARPSFTQSIQYDLSKSNLIGFKDGELEIIEATNTEISYTVRSNF
ncbi:hypothetical protein N8936_02535 [Porticoccaceae bacterium]|nr:hypothetical protein [Porticoccaceae bacterium]